MHSCLGCTSASAVEILLGLAWHFLACRGLFAGGEPTTLDCPWRKWATRQLDMPICAFAGLTPLSLVLTSTPFSEMSAAWPAQAPDAFWVLSPSAQFLSMFSWLVGAG